MVEENKEAVQPIKFDTCYKGIENYIELCNHASGEVKESEKNFVKSQYNKMWQIMADTGVDSLKVYINVLKKLRVDHDEWKKDIKDVLVSAESLNLFRSARKDIMSLYPVLVDVDNTFSKSVEKYPELSLNPNTAMYGSEIKKTKDSVDKKSPLKNEEYQAMLELFQEKKDSRRLGIWLMEILMFKPEKMVDGYEELFNNARQELKEWAYKKINTDKRYMRAMTDMLVKEKLLDKLIGAYIKQDNHVGEMTALQSQLKNQEEERRQEKQDFEERRLKQLKRIEEKDIKISALENQLRDFEKCKVQLEEYVKRHQAQLIMNERLTLDAESRIMKLEDENARLDDKLYEVQETYDQLKKAKEAIEVDLNLKAVEVKQLNDKLKHQKKTTRIELMKDLVDGLNEQLFYLTMYYLDLKDNGKLEPDNIEAYGNTLKNIDEVLDKMGIKKIGELEQCVPYDSSMHDAMGDTIANGDNVIVNGYGWKIEEDVFIKAYVQREV